VTPRGKRHRGNKETITQKNTGKRKMNSPTRTACAGGNRSRGGEGRKKKKKACKRRYHTSNQPKGAGPAEKTTVLAEK